MWSNRQKIDVADAGRARQRPSGPTRQWRVPGAHVVDVRGSPGDRVGGTVSVVTLSLKKVCTDRSVLVLKGTIVLKGDDHGTPRRLCVRALGLLRAPRT